MKRISAHLVAHQSKYLFCLGVTALLAIAFRVVGASPAIMPDEYQYSLAARHLPMSDAQIPDYLFYWVYSLTSLAGEHFYIAAKLLNIAFLAGTAVFTFAIAKRFVPPQLASVVALLIFLGPLSTYTSFFMPESMEFFAISLFVWYLLRIESTDGWISWLSRGAILGLAALVKPHSLFLIPAVGLFLVYFSSAFTERRVRNLAIRFSAFLAGLITAKFGLGFLFAGIHGLTLFGATYSSSLATLTSTGGNLTPTNVTVSPTPSAETGNIFLNFVGVTAAETAAHAVAAIFLYGLPVALLASNLPKAIRNRRNPSEVERLSVFVAGSLVVMILVVAAFTALLTVQGVDHSSRIMLRYYDFLMPLVIITGLALLKNPIQKNKTVTIITALVVATVSVVTAATKFSPYRPQFFDSPALQGTLTEPAYTVLFCAVSVVALISWIASKGIATKIFTWVYLPVFLIGAGYFAFSPIANSKQINDYDRGARFAKDYLSADELERLTVVGPQQYLLQRSLFVLDSPKVDFKLVNRGDNFGFEYLEPGKDWVLEIGEVHSSASASVRINGNGFSLLKVERKPEYYFSSPIGSSFVSSATGLGVSEPSGAWTVGGETTIKFDQPLPANARVRLTFEASRSLSGKTSEITLGDSSLAISASEEPIDGILEFKNLSASDTLTIKTELPESPKSLGISQDTRAVGYKLIYIGLENK